MKLCECGCGGEVRINKNRFLRGHSNKGKSHSAEHKRKIGEASKNRIVTEETRKKLSSALKGKTQEEGRRRKTSERQKGKPTWNKNKKMDQTWKDRCSTNFLGKKHSEDTKYKMRLYTIRRIEDQRINNEPLTPFIGKDERIFLNEVEKLLGLKVQRQFAIRGYFIDGYIPKLNLAFEFDELRNHTNVKRDTERQNEIQYFLNCRFFRVTDLEWKNNKNEILNRIRKFKYVID